VTFVGLLSLQHDEKIERGEEVEGEITRDTTFNGREKK
jgi:hypothetical protein